MATYLYCLLPANADAPPPALAGVAGTAVRVLAADGLIAWVSDVAGQPRASAAALAEHDAVTAAAVGTGATPLPMRFGQLFASDDACVASLVERRDSLARSLSALAGCVEMTVSIGLATPPTATAAKGAAPGETGQGGPGRAYMEQLRAARAQERVIADVAATAAAPIIAAVQPFVRREVRTLRASPAVLHLSHLIARGDISAYRRALAGLAGPGGASPLVSGPSAPYSFATRDDD